MSGSGSSSSLANFAVTNYHKHAPFALQFLLATLASIDAFIAAYSHAKAGVLGWNPTSSVYSAASALPLLFNKKESQPAKEGLLIASGTLAFYFVFRVIARLAEWKRVQNTRKFLVWVLGLHLLSFILFTVAVALEKSQQSAAVMTKRNLHDSGPHNRFDLLCKLLVAWSSAASAGFTHQFALGVDCEELKQPEFNRGRWLVPETRVRTWFFDAAVWIAIVSAVFCCSWLTANDAMIWGIPIVSVLLVLAIASALLCPPALMPHKAAPERDEEALYPDW